MTLWTLIADFFTLDPAITAQATEQVAFIPILIAAAGTAASMYAQKRAQDQAEDQAGKGNQMTENARQEAMQRLSPEAMYTAFQTFFPGLTNDPTAGTSMGQPAKMVGQGPGAGMKNYDSEDPGITQAAAYNPNPGAGAESYDVARADGGPVEDGQNVLVGEEGPEILQMEGDGNVIPNPATAAGEVGIGAPSELPGEEAPVVDDPGSPPGQKVVQGGFEQDPTTATDLVMGHVFDQLTNPGRFSTADYERQQEAASAGYQARVQDIDAQAMAGGIDPGSGAANTMKASAATAEAKLKSEASRNQQLLEQQLRRADIASGTQVYMQMMNYILQLQGMRSGAASQTFNNQQVTANDWMSKGIGEAADIAIDAYNSTQADKAAKSSGPDMGGQTPTDPLGWNS